MEERKEEKEAKSKIDRENSGPRHVELKSHTIPPFTGVEPPVFSLCRIQCAPFSRFVGGDVTGKSKEKYGEWKRGCWGTKK